jgi:hypothetical protein
MSLCVKTHLYVIAIDYVTSDKSVVTGVLVEVELAVALPVVFVECAKVVANGLKWL